MFVVEIWPRGVGEVRLEAGSHSAEDLDLAVWPVVREALDELDRRLRARRSVVEPVARPIAHAPPRPALSLPDDGGVAAP
jgi:hypothetical protein